jgi:hypothetical protein
MLAIYKQVEKEVRLIGYHLSKTENIQLLTADYIWLHVHLRFGLNRCLFLTRRKCLSYFE